MYKQIILLILFVGLLEGVNAQKGDISVSAGPLVSFPLNIENIFFELNSGLGLEAIGQYNFSNKSSVLVQTSWASYGIKRRAGFDTGSRSRATIFSVRVGYKYQFGKSGFYANILGGIEMYSLDDYRNSTLAFGIGKRFFINDLYFIDAGVDCVGGSTDTRINVKALFSIFQKIKE